MEEEILTQRYITDLTSIKKLVSQYSHLITLLNSESPNENITELYQNFIDELSQYQFNLIKSTKIVATNDREIEHTKLEIESVNSSIKKLNEEVSSLKNELLHEKSVRKNKEECEALVKLINQFPTIEEANSEIEEVTKRIASLNEEKQHLEKEVNSKAKSLSLLLHSIDMLSSNK